MVDFVVKCLDIVFYPLLSESNLILIPFYIIFISFLFILFFNLMRGKR